MGWTKHSDDSPYLPRRRREHRGEEREDQEELLERELAEQPEEDASCSF